MTEYRQDIFITCIDFLDRRVHLTRQVADHVKARHLEMKPYLERVCDVVEAPDLVYFRSRVNSHLFYKLGVLPGKLASTHMAVIVR